MFASAVRANFFRGVCHNIHCYNKIIFNRNLSGERWNVCARTSPAWKPIVPASLYFGGLLSLLGMGRKEEEKEDPVVHTIKLGILNMQRGEYKKAERLLHLALKMSQEREDSQAVTYCFDVMAEVALANEELEKAEKLFIEVMRRLISSGTNQDDNAIIEISAKLATIFSRRGDDIKAEQGFQFCIDTQRQKLKDITEDPSKVSLTEEEENSLALWGMCLDWYAKHLMDRGRHAEARELLTKALQAARKVFGEAHPQTLVIRNDLALSHTMLKDYQMSIRILEDLIASGAADESEDLPTFLCNLGENYFASGDFSNAEKLCGQAENVARRQNNQNALKNARACLIKAREKNKTGMSPT